MARVPLYRKTSCTMNAETRRIYKDTPLACLPPCEQRNAMEGAARGHLASVGVAADVAVHATTMSWDDKRRRFYLKFDNVCVDGHRAVYIVWQTPRGIHIFQHDGVGSRSRYWQAAPLFTSWWCSRSLGSPVTVPPPLRRCSPSCWSLGLVDARGLGHTQRSCGGGVSERSVHSRV